MSENERKELFVRLKFFLFFRPLWKHGRNPRGSGAGTVPLPGPPSSLFATALSTEHDHTSTLHPTLDCLRTLLHDDEEGVLPLRRRTGDDGGGGGVLPRPEPRTGPAGRVLRLPRLRPVRWDALKGLRCGRAVGHGR